MSGKKYRIAVTGGMGSGKSEFCKVLETNGFPVLKADDISKDLLLSDKNIRQKIIKAFGKESYNPSGINNAYIAGIIFSDYRRLKEINSILHPEVIRQIDFKMKDILKQHNIVITEAALIYEAEMEDMYDYVVLVYTEEEKRFARLMKKKNFSREDIAKRIEAQMPDEEKKNWADFVFENNGTLKDLKQKAEFFTTILKSFSKPVK